MENLEIYNKGRQVPPEAKKQIQGGRLKGMTDINPMWRIKKLTEIFGPCGLGWYTKTTNHWTEEGTGGERVAWVRVELYVKYDGEWSQPIEGIGGASTITQEKTGLRTDDEAYKKATTDAMSVACKSLGIGADVYFDKDSTKYTTYQENGAKTAQNEPKTKAQEQPQQPERMYSMKDIDAILEGTEMTIDRVKAWAEAKFKKPLEQLEQSELYALCTKLKIQLGKE